MGWRLLSHKIREIGIPFFKKIKKKRNLMLKINITLIYNGSMKKQPKKEENLWNS